MTYYFNRLACHGVYSAKLTGKSVCVVADDTVFILLHVSIVMKPCTSVKLLHL